MKEVFWSFVLVLLMLPAALLGAVLNWVPSKARGSRAGGVRDHDGSTS